MADINEQDLLAQVEAEIGNLSEDDIKSQLLAMRTRQKVQQKKQYGSGKQKEYQAKQRAKVNALKAKAKELGLWDAIEKEADEQAEQKLAEESTTEQETVTA